MEFDPGRSEFTSMLHDLWEGRSPSYERSAPLDAKIIKLLSDVSREGGREWKTCCRWAVIGIVSGQVLAESAGIFSTVSNVPLLVQCRQFEDSIIKGNPPSLELLLSQSKHLQLMKVYSGISCCEPEAESGKAD